MLAAVLHEAPGKPLIEDVRIDAPGPGEVRIKTSAAGVCHTELHVMQGRSPATCPVVLGHESAGVIDAVGEGVTYVAQGDHVITCISRFCGECFQCLTGHPALCSLVSTGRKAAMPPSLRVGGHSATAFAGIGSFAEELLVSERSVVRIDADIPLDRASLIGCAVLTGVGAVFNTAQVRPGSTVVVIGCGGIGLNCIQGARLAGALRIVAVDIDDEKLDLATVFGATDTVKGDTSKTVDEIRDITRGGADYTFEAIGMPDTVRQSVQVLRRGGVSTIIGLLGPDIVAAISGADLIEERRIQGCRMGSNRFRLDVPMILGLYRQDRLLLDELISERVGLGELNQAYDALAAGKVARNVVVFDQ